MPFTGRSSAATHCSTVVAPRRSERRRTKLFPRARDARTIGSMIEARDPTTQLLAQPEQRAGRLYTIEPSPQPALPADVASNSHRSATSFSVPFRP
jgi:hypothetical protein